MTEHNLVHHTHQSAHAHHEHAQKNWYDKSYKWMLLIPLALFVFSIIYLTQFYSREGDLIYKDVSLTGGTTVTVFDSKVDLKDLEQNLKIEFEDISVRGISDIRTGKQQGFFVESKSDATSLKKALEEYLGHELNNENSSVEFSGSNLSSGFYSQLRNSIIAAFLLMGWVVFIIFSNSNKNKALATVLTFICAKILLGGIPSIKAITFLGIVGGFAYGLFQKDMRKNDYLMLSGISALALASWIFYSPEFLIIPLGIILIGLYTFTSIPSTAIIAAAFADIIMTLVVINIMGVQLSSAGIIAFLMLIGYSVDTDILLTSRLLKNKEGSINHRIYGAFKTGITMTLAAIVSVGIAFGIIFQFSDTLAQIFGIILIGLVFDIINTWVTNASILKWFMEVKKIE